MSLPEPRPGLVIRYDYLWTREAAVGRDQERSAQPVWSLPWTPPPRRASLSFFPITHAWPERGTVGVEIPAKVREVLGLDAID